MCKRLRPYLERFWIWLGGEPPSVESRVSMDLGAGQFEYIVQPGDTLSSIARRFGTSIWVLADLNDLDDPSSVSVGQRLLIPRPGVSLAVPSRSPEAESELLLETEAGPFLYIVQTGDTLDSIAGRFGVAEAAILETNRIQDPSLIHPGQRLLIPEPETQLGPEPVPATEAEPGPEPKRPELKPIVLPLPGFPPERVAEDGLWPIPWPDEAIRGIYVSYFALGHEARRRRVSDLLTKTEINALVIDVKGDNGLISYPTRVALAQEIGAARPTARDFDELMDFFKANNVYTIARIVAFKDHLFAVAHPEWAVQREGGRLWHDQGGRAWANPFTQATWEYSADLAEEAARRGFDEIQFDSVRFPIPSQEGAPQFSQSSDRGSPVEAITSFLSYVRGRLSSLEVRVAANVFGYSCWHEDATFIGQDITRMADYLDVLCPKLYPSTFGRGIPGYKHAIAYPYEIVHESMKRLADQVSSPDCRVRPWIQDFPDFRFDRRFYGSDEVRAQIRGSFDAGGDGYMAWDPKNRYTAEAYFQKTIDMSLSDDYN